MFRSFFRVGGYVLAAIAFLVVFYAAIVMAGLWFGSRANDERAIADFATKNARQLELAEVDIENGEFELALDRLEYLETRIPGDNSVAALAATLTANAATIEPTRPLPTPVIMRSGEEPVATEEIPPTPEATETPQPLPTRAPTRIATVEHPEDIKRKLVDIEESLDNERWEDAISNLIAFQLDHPDYERFYTDSLLFNAYNGAGFEFTNSNRVSLGINYFEQAEKLGELPEDAVSQLYFSRVYLAAMSFYGVDWPRSVNRLEEICSIAPLFQDSCSTLFNARVAWGDQLSIAEEHCLALEQYTLALRVGTSRDVSQKMSTAEWKCRSATPTPWQADS